jgi:hypothetical protein
LLDGTCTQRILPLLAKACAVESTLASLGIDLCDLIAAEWRMSESQSLGSVLDHWRGRIHTGECGTAPNKKFIVVTWTK